MFESNDKLRMRLEEVTQALRTSERRYRAILAEYPDDLEARFPEERVLIDHVEEHTVRVAKEDGFWCAMTLYPLTKCTPARAADIIEMYGDDRIMVNSAGDWGPSNPLAVPDFIMEMRRRGHPESKIRKIVYDNPLEFFRQIRTVMLTAFATSSSNATLPTALKVAQEEVGLPRDISSFVLSVGATAVVVPKDKAVGITPTVRRASAGGTE